MALIDRFVPASLAAIGQLARETEAGPYDGLWVTENRHDPFPSMAIAAEHTQRITLGTGVAIAFARTPMTVAYPAWELSQFSEGRFVLGLGSQVRAHVTNRFGMPFTEPAERMREFVDALREIFRCWSTGERLRFEGRFYRHTLMTDNFVPPSTGHGPPRIFVAAVGPRMTEVAGMVSDGLIAHPFLTESYARERLLPGLEAGSKKSGRTTESVETVGAIFVVTGDNDTEFLAAETAVKNRIGFYGATPSYRPVLDHHGMGELQPRLNDLARQGEWAEMGALVPRELYDAMVISGSPDQVGAELHRRFGEVFDRLSLNAPYALSARAADEVAAAFRKAAYSSSITGSTPP